MSGLHQKFYNLCNQIPENHHTIIFRADPIPVFLDAFLKVVFRTKHIRTIALSDFSYAEFKTLTAMSLLGQSCLYWVGDISAADDDVIEYIAHYQGPHTIIAVVQKDLNIPEQSASVVTIPEYINEQMALTVISQGNSVSFYNKHLIKDFFAHQQRTLDDFMRLLPYVNVVRSHYTKEFTQSMLSHVSQHTSSLFTLSGAFFARDTTFFSLWYDLRLQYQYPFWMSFWSDQLFRAALFVRYAQTNQLSYAKKISTRLPFSFTKKDWKHYSYEELLEAHQTLYHLDWIFKNGGSSLSLDFFCTQFVIEKA